ncbi:SPOR domain-containing protein [Helicobacter sp. UBA3407]|nr:SPOR domain-containing protein [Helicobacter sp. UBA3407]
MTSKPEIKQEPSKTTPKESFKDVKVNNPSLQGSEAGKGFYVQVGSFSKFSPNKQLLGLINENKLSYRMQKSGDNNRLLIGPYTTKQEAQNKLSEIRAKINKDAFIKEIK